MPARGRGLLQRLECPLRPPGVECSTAASGWPSPSSLATLMPWRLSVPSRARLRVGGSVTITTRAQLGWQRGDFSHLVYVQAVAPTGRWRPGFPPTIGLHRPGIDTGWAFSWEHKPSKLQLNGSAGLRFNFEDAETDYKTGNEFHFEWAIGRVRNGACHWHCRLRLPAAHGRPRRRRPDRPVQGQGRCDRGRRQLYEAH
jgi:hypothetical protein